MVGAQVKAKNKQALLEGALQCLRDKGYAATRARRDPEVRAGLVEQLRPLKTLAASMFDQPRSPQARARRPDPSTPVAVILAIGDGLLTQLLLDPATAPSADDLFAFLDTVWG